MTVPDECPVLSGWAILLSSAMTRHARRAFAIGRLRENGESGQLETLEALIQFVHHLSLIGPFFSQLLSLVQHLLSARIEKRNTVN